MLRRIAAVGSVAIAASACSTGINGMVPEQEVEKQAAIAVRSSGTDVTRVDCPGDLRAKVKATMDCTVTSPQGQRIPVVMTVTSVSGDRARFTVLTKR